MTGLLFDEPALMRARPRERLIVLLSAGEGSFRAAKIAKLLNPGASFLYVFTDTLYEDADAYRFLLESAAHLSDRTLDWIPKAEDFPDYRVSADVSIEEYRGNPEWRGFLADLRAMAAIALPELVWLVDGRDPWEIYRDEKFVGNSQIDPCSKILKREQFLHWIERNGNPHRDVLVYGIGGGEAHRFDDGDGHGLRPRWADRGWRCEAPIAQIDALDLDADLRWAHETLPKQVWWIIAAPIEEFGLKRPRLYLLGYAHNNCGGKCCKAGMAHWQHRLRVQPNRYFYDAMMERKLRIYLKTDAGTFLTDRSGGTKTPLSLEEFAIRCGADPSVTYEYEQGTSGCGCMTDLGEDVA